MKEYNGIINISEPDNDYSIYKMYSSNTEDISIYIGATKDYKQRCYKHSVDRIRNRESHKPLYVWMCNVIDIEKRNIIFEIIEKELSEQEAFKKEILYIEKAKRDGFNVLNISQGGKGNTGIPPWNKGKKNPYTKEQLQKLSKSHLGIVGGMKDKKHSLETKHLISKKNQERKEMGWKNPRKKKVYKYSQDNVLLNTYNCAKEASIDMKVHSSSISEWCRKVKTPKSNNFKWEYNLLIN